MCLLKKYPACGKGVWDVFNDTAVAVVVRSSS